MKKSVVILIAVIYVASIFIINLFGMQMKIYNQFYPVENIVCLNETEENVTVTSMEYPINGFNKPFINIKYIEVPFTTPADIETNTGTMLFLQLRAYPDNCTNKKFKFIDLFENPDVQFYKDESGQENGLILFKERGAALIKVMSLDENNPLALYIMVEAI